MDSFLFVYGTLKRAINHPAHVLLEKDCEYVGEGYFHGTLYHVTNYPAAVVSDITTEKVYGEVYRIISGDLLFQRLDDYEECSDTLPQPHEYKRLQVSIYMDLKVIKAWVYVYNLNPEGLKSIMSGCYEVERKRN